MTILKRKFMNKAGVVVVYEYDTKTKQTNAKQKREHLMKFIEEHQSEINELPTKKLKIDFIMSNINKAYEQGSQPKAYSYSYSMITRYI
jgi:hypothetical protein